MPPKRRVVDPSACVKASKTVSNVSAAMPTPVLNARHQMYGSLVSRTVEVDQHVTTFSELHGVAHEVEQHLTKPASIGDDEVRQ